MLPGAETLLGGEHLPADDSPCVEEFVVAADQLHLPDGRVELAGRHGVEPVAGRDHPAPCGDSARRHDDDLDAGTVQGCDLVGQRRHAVGIERAVGAGQHVAAHLYDDAPEAAACRVWCDVRILHDVYRLSRYSLNASNSAPSATVRFSPLTNSCKRCGISTGRPVMLSTVSRNLAGWAVSRKMPVSPSRSPSRSAR